MTIQVILTKGKDSQKETCLHLEANSTIMKEDWALAKIKVHSLKSFITD